MEKAKTAEDTVTDRSRVSLATLRSAPTTATASSTTPSSAVLSSFSHTSCYNSDHANYVTGVKS